ncbi:MAG: Delta(24)-sterol C-methyltransferase [Watsoniomyces obsoletus]|nr:MAG: Delta(24)-sterol C-methyltransferase [Watsoniomyces obsoletus]
MLSPSREASVRASVANRDSSHPSPSMPPHVLAALAHPARMRSDESWVEISSRPSSSSLSSAAADEIVTTGLRVHHRGSHAPRPPKRRRGPLARSNLHPAPTGSRSSQDEYDETESEEDQIMTSSNEHVNAAASPSDGSGPSEGDEHHDAGQDEDHDDDEDENSTALGVGQATGFTPQPNVFSHPPRSQQRGTRSDPASYFAPRNSHAPTSGRPPSARHPQHSPYNLITPSHQADHDAALRASLSTLLSCAAAARGLSKPARFPARAGPVSGSGVQPETLQIVSESTRFGTEPSHDSAKSVPSSGVGPTLEERDHHDEMNGGRFVPRTTKTKRKTLASSPVKGHSSAKDHQQRVSKKAQRTALLEGNSISPSLLTWVLSAGVVVLVSAISFSAGYAMGKEVGRTEVSVMDWSDEGKSCGREAVRGLRRFRWSTGRTGTVVG